MIDSDRCLVAIARDSRPCDMAGSIFVGWEGYICASHASEIWRRVEMRDATPSDDPVPGQEGREYVRADARKKRAETRRKPTAHGQIYFVQVDGLIKVGWTSKLADRIRAYGPKAVLLAHYPGTRREESALHRQLTPSRAHGREWYHDGDVVRLFVNETLAKHGPPRFESIAWTEPRQTVAGKKAMRYRN